MNYLFLAGAILFETIGTTALSQSDGFTKPGPSIIVAIAFAISFYCLSLALRTIPVGIAYAIWAGVGMVLITLIGWVVLKQTLDSAALLGIGFIMAGVITLQLFSKAGELPH